jgi:hypothetical protein
VIILTQIFEWENAAYIYYLKTRITPVQVEQLRSFKNDETQ